MIQQKAFTLTQGGADTAAETTIPTLIQPGITLGAWEIVGIELTLKPDLMKAWAAADADFTIQFTKRSLSGSIARIITYTDTDLIATFNLAVNLAGTAANLAVYETTWFLQMPPGLIVYSENMYGQIISAATGQTNVAWGRILYNPVTLTQSQAMAVIASRP
jgi:hypothetical protein